MPATNTIADEIKIHRKIPKANFRLKSSNNPRYRTMALQKKAIHRLDNVKAKNPGTEVNSTSIYPIFQNQTGRTLYNHGHQL
jgi:hypothetical protein